MIDPNGPAFPPESVGVVTEAGKKPEELLITKRFWAPLTTLPSKPNYVNAMWTPL